MTGVDLNQKMLDELLKKHGDKKLKTVCADYFQYEIGDSRYDAEGEKEMESRRGGLFILIRP